MGREIRMVPPNYEHPKETKPNHRLGRMEERYKPMRDCSVEERFTEWLAEFQEWKDSEGDRLREKYGDKDYPKDQPYRSFCNWKGQPPDPEDYMPPFTEPATWFQVWETVSEGTPVTPPFATKEEMVEYLVANGDFWDQSRRKEGGCPMPCGPWERESAMRFVFGSGWSPSMVVKTGPEGVQIQTAGHGL